MTMRQTVQATSAYLSLYVNAKDAAQKYRCHVTTADDIS